ncbi:hypothetical protein BDF19DRAFT_403276 [Syncephalis fuscata]|nr:hypothetical protein BDF19DRAFT_403276 [Syncephalis fuscata]
MASFKFTFTNLRAAVRARPILALSVTNGVLAGVSDILAQKIAHSSTTATTTATTTTNTASNESNKSSESKPTEELLSDSTVADTGATAVRLSAVLSPSTSQPQEENASLNLTRTVRFATYGFAIAPIIHHWYALLDRRFPLPILSSASGSQMSSRMLGQVFKRVLGDQIVFAPIGLAVFFSAMTLFEGGGVEQIKEKIATSYTSALKANYMVWPTVQFVNFCFVPLLLRVPFVSAVSVFWNSYLSYLNNRRDVSAPSEAIA